MSCPIGLPGFNVLADIICGVTTERNKEIDEIDVVVPDGSGPGDMIKVVTKYGTDETKVPEGLEPGKIFTFPIKTGCKYNGPPEDLKNAYSDKQINLIYKGGLLQPDISVKISEIFTTISSDKKQIIAHAFIKSCRQIMEEIMAAPAGAFDMPASVCAAGSASDPDLKCNEQLSD